MGTLSLKTHLAQGEALHLTGHGTVSLKVGKGISIAKLGGLSSGLHGAGLKAGLLSFGIPGGSVVGPLAGLIGVGLAVYYLSRSISR
ncbi:MAG: hypothetical protein HQL82_13100 [Magnetococcales bacterium]|nr:hypothetical protein [Magnetococcales bacterium]